MCRMLMYMSIRYWDRLKRLIYKEDNIMNRTIYKVVFLNEMYFVQERSFETAAAAADYATTITGWKVTLKIETTGTVTVVT
jgi:hypothetical protein